MGLSERLALLEPPEYGGEPDVYSWLEDFRIFWSNYKLRTTIKPNTKKCKIALDAIMMTILKFSGSMAHLAKIRSWTIASYWTDKTAMKTKVEKNAQGQDVVVPGADDVEQPDDLTDLFVAEVKMEVEAMYADIDESIRSDWQWKSRDFVYKSALEMLHRSNNRTMDLLIYDRLLKLCPEDKRRLLARDADNSEKLVECLRKFDMAENRLQRGTVSGFLTLTGNQPGKLPLSNSTSATTTEASSSSLPSSSSLNDEPNVNAADFMNNRWRKQKRFNHREKGTNKEETAVVCYFCSQSGHMMRNCPKLLEKKRVMKSSQRGKQHFTNTAVEDPNTEEPSPLEVIHDCYSTVEEVTKVDITDEQPAPLANMIDAKIGGANASMMIDTGSSVDFIHRKILGKVDGTIVKLGKPWKINFAGTNVRQFEEVLHTRVDIGLESMDVKFLVHDTLNCDALIGGNTIKRNGIKIDMEHDRIQLKKTKLMLKPKAVTNSTNATTVDGNDIESLKKEFGDIFKEKLDVAGLAKVEVVDIQTVSESAKWIRNRRMSDQEWRTIDIEVEKMLEASVIEPEKINSSSKGWNSPILLVKKKDGTIRFCIDFRALNSMLMKKNIPLPRTDEALEQVKGSKLISTLDLTSAYWQIPIKEEHRQLLTFSTRSRRYRFKVLPYGITIAPGVFQEIINNLVMDIDGVVGYLDDIVIFSETMEQHLAQIRKVFERLRAVKIFVKPTKCRFLQEKVLYLGHVVSSEGISANPERVSAIINMPTPNSEKELRSFLGMVEYLKDYIPFRAELLHSLYEATSEWKWTKKQEDAFNNVKLRIAKMSTLKKFKPGLKTQLHTDASNVGIGAVLVQFGPNDEEKHIAYFSRILSKSEKNYPTIKKEFLAIAEALKAFHPYLHGNMFTILTDHKPLVGLVKAEAGADVLMNRWMAQLMVYDAVVAYRKGKLNADADALSRLPQSNSANIVNIEWYQAQVKDAECREIKENIKARKDMKIINGIIYKKIDGKLRLYVPSEWRVNCLTEAHSGEFGGHFGVEKTVALLKKHYFWPGIWKDTQAFCESCDICIQKKKSKMQHGIPANLEIGGPWETIAMDVVGPYPPSSDGNRFLLVGIDMFTKNVEVIATPTTSTDVVIRFILNEICYKHGIPKIILTDNGRNFLAEAVSEVYKKLGIIRKTSTPYNPQGNSVVERFNGTLTKLIRLSCGGDPNYSDWDKHLAGALFAYRITPHDTTGESPFFLDHGRDPNMPLESLVEAMEVDPQRYRNEIKKVLEIAWENANRRIIKANLSRNERLEASQPSTTFQIGDLVYWHEESREGSTKLHWPWKGPARIIDKLNHATYSIEDLESKKVFYKINVKRLRKMNHVISRDYGESRVYVPWRQAVAPFDYDEQVRTPSKMTTSAEFNQVPNLGTEPVIAKNKESITTPRKPQQSPSSTPLKPPSVQKTFQNPPEEPGVVGTIGKLDLEEASQSDKLSNFKNRIHSLLDGNKDARIKRDNTNIIGAYVRDWNVEKSLKAALRAPLETRDSQVEAVLNQLTDEDIKEEV